MKNFRTIIATALAIGFIIGLVAHPVAQTSLMRIQPGSAATPGLSDTVTGTLGYWWGVTYVGIRGHIGVAQATAPSLGTCGSSPVLATGSTDVAGRFQVKDTGCVLTFATAWTTAPFCVVKNQTRADVITYAATTTALTIAAATADDFINYVCVGNSGG
jgi:hypothetical protein